MAGWTNRGKYDVMRQAFQGNASPSGFYVALVTSASVPGASKNVITDLVEVASGNGYSTGGASVTRGSAGFDVMTEDDAASRAYARIIDVVWTAAGGELPAASGGGARYAVLLDANVSPSLRAVYAYWDLSSSRQVSDGQTLTLQDLELRLDEA